MADRDLWDRLQDGAVGAVESLDDESVNPMLAQRNAATMGLNALKGFASGFLFGKKDTGVKFVPKMQQTTPPRQPVPMPTPQQVPTGTQGTRFMGETRENGKKFYLWEDPNSGRKVKTDDRGNIIWSRWSV